jgi:hypothetical protein
MSIVDEVIDTVEMEENTRVRLAEAMVFALDNPERFRDFIAKLNYCINWGKNGDREIKPTRVAIMPDFVKHSFVFCIWSYRYKDGCILTDNVPFTLAMIYDKTDDKWGTHS